MPRSTTVVASPGMPGARTTGPSPITARRSSWTPQTRCFITTAAIPGTPSRSTTRPSPTTTRRSELNPKFAVAYHNRGYAWHEEGRSRQGHRRLQRGDPPRPQVRVALHQPGQRLGREGDRQGHRRLRPRRSGSIPRTPCLHQPGHRLEERRSTTRPSPTSTRRSGSIPSIATAYINRGIAWNDKEEYDKAIADFNEAIRLDPEDAQAYIDRGDAW